jgi:uncharacterized membrane protein
VAAERAGVSREDEQPAHTAGTPLRADKARLETLCDGVFAIVMTLLVLELIPRNLPLHAGDAALRAYLGALWPKFVSYLISFVAVAHYWVGHHAEFQYIRYTDRRHVWINITLLLAVSLIPFSAALLGSEYDSSIGVQLYGLNLVVAGCALAANWGYATHQRRLTDERLPTAVVHWFMRRIVFGPLLYLGAVVIAWASPHAAFMIYVASAVLYVGIQVGPTERQALAESHEGDIFAP